MFREIIKSKKGGKTDSEEFKRAIMLHDMKNVKSLVLRGAEINAPDKKGFTPLFYAFIAKDFEIASYLANNGADVNVKAYGNSSLMDYAIYMGDVRFVKLLKDKGYKELDAAVTLALRSMRHDIVVILTGNNEY